MWTKWSAGEVAYQVVYLTTPIYVSCFLVLSLHYIWTRTRKQMNWVFLLFVWFCFFYLYLNSFPVVFWWTSLKKDMCNAEVQVSKGRATIQNVKTAGGRGQPVVQLLTGVSHFTRRACGCSCLVRLQELLLRACMHACVCAWVVTCLVTRVMLGHTVQGCSLFRTTCFDSLEVVEEGENGFRKSWKNITVKHPYSYF